MQKHESPQETVEILQEQNMDIGMDIRDVTENTIV